MQNPISIKNTQLVAPIQGRLNVKGPPNGPILNGKLNFEYGGQILFRDNTFDLQRGFVEFDNTAPNNPSLFIAAQSSIETENIVYDVSMQLKGTAQQPELSLSSVPPLKEIDIVSLLALGVTTSELDTADSQIQLDRTSYQIGSALLASPLGRQFKDRFGVDLKLSSDIEAVDDTSAGTAVPKVTIKKQFSPRTSVAASRTLGDSPKTNVKAQYNFNNNLSIIGFWDTAETTSQESNESSSNDTIGVDLEYRFQFK